MVIKAYQEEVKALEASIPKNGTLKKLRRAQKALKEATQELDMSLLVPSLPEVVFGATKAVEIQKLNEEQDRSLRKDEIDSDAKRRRKEEKALRAAAVAETPKKSNRDEPSIQTQSKQLMDLRQLVKPPILPPQKQQTGYGPSSTTRSAQSSGVSITPRQDSKIDSIHKVEHLVQNTSDQLKLNDDPYKWMPASWKESFVGTANHVRSTFRENSAGNLGVPNQFSWLPSAQRDSLLDTIRIPRTDVEGTTEDHSALTKPKPRFSFDLTLQPNLFSSGINKSPVPAPTTAKTVEGLFSTLPAKSMAIIPTSVLPTISNTDSSDVNSRAKPATILPPSRDYVVLGTPQATIVSSSAKNVILPPNSTNSQRDITVSSKIKSFTILPPAIRTPSSTSKVTKVSRSSNDSPTLPPNFHRTVSLPKTSLSPTRDIGYALILPAIFPTIEPHIQANSDQSGPMDTDAPTTITKFRGGSAKRSRGVEQASEDKPEANHKRQKRTITATGSPSPILPPTLHTRSKSDPPVITRNLDLMLTQQEEWEVTGGRFRGRVNLSEDKNDDAEVEENIAFSSLYIQNRSKPIGIANLKFQIVRLASSESTDMTGENGVKVCSVARGRVKVNIFGKKFSIGEHGMWRIRGGESCKMRNPVSEEAVVHISNCWLLLG